MSHIRSKNTGIEKRIFFLLDKKRIRYQKHYKTYGKPDIAFPRIKLAVFLDSDFWHGWHFSKWRNKLPKAYWRTKIANNIRRDKSNLAKLRRKGWEVIRLWEHQILKNPEQCVKIIIRKAKR